jgi:hypothetical protein
MSGKLLYPNNNFNLCEYNKNYKTLVANIGNIISSKYTISLKKSPKPASSPILALLKKEMSKPIKKLKKLIDSYNLTIFS